MLNFKNESKKRLFAGAAAAIMLLSAAGCGGKSDKDTGSDVSSSGGSGISAGNVDTSGSKIANKDYGGEYFKMLFRWEPGDITTRTIEAFNRDHNAYIDVVVDTSNTVYENLAVAIAGGDPYDLVCVYDYWFPNFVTQDLVEPLDSYFDEVDLYSTDKPDNGGISKQFTEHYTLNDKVYAVGSSRSVYQLMMYYNKKLFNEAGLEDPWTLYKAGNWNWSKFTEMGKSVTDTAKGIGFTSLGDVHAWLSLCGTQVIKKDDDGSYRSCAKDADVINVLKEYKSMYLGTDPICVSGASFAKGTQYCEFAAITAYSGKVNSATESTAFDRDSSNLGVVPCPIPELNTTGGYPVHASTGYASCKGAKDPSIAVCFALYESRIKDTNTGSATQLDSEVYEAIVAEYEKNPAFTYDGFANSSGVSVGEYYRDNVGKPILEGADVTQTLSNAHSIIEGMIASSLNK